MKSPHEKRCGDVTVLLVGAFVLLFVVLLVIIMLVGVGNRVQIAVRQAENAENRAEDPARAQLLASSDEKDSIESLWSEINKSKIALDEQAPKVDLKQNENEKPAQPATKRPAWVDTKPPRVGNIYSRVVSSEPFTTEEECHKYLEPKLRSIVRDRLNDLPDARRSNDLDAIGVGLDYILGTICADEYTETTQHDFGDMSKVHLLMEFTPEVDRHLVRASNIHLRERRIEGLLIACSIVLAILAGLYLLLKIDTWTRGYYTKRLFFGVPAAIIGVVLLAVIIDSIH